MSAITLDLIRRRAEHNSGIVATLEELSLHAQNIEKIELLGQACRHLRILYLQNNVIGRIENVHKLKELEYLNLALNNVQLVENLDGCESLAKLDLTANFIGAPGGLLSVAQLQRNHALSELFLSGNPCCKDDGYRDFVIATLPQLTRLDGTDVTPKERIRAAQALPLIRARLEADLAAELPKPKHAADCGEEGAWGPEERLRQHREDAAELVEREAAKKEQAMRLLSGDGSAPKAAQPKRTAFDELSPDSAVLPQKNEGAFQYTLTDSPDGGAVVLEVAVGRFMDTSDIKVDVQPLVVRCLIRGRLLQVHTVEEVCPGDSSCQRSTVTGSLVVSMRKAGAVVSARAAQPQPKRAGGAVASLHVVDGARQREAVAVPHAQLTGVYADGDLDAPPPLLA